MLNPTAGRKKAPEPWPIAAVADAVVTTDDSWVIRSWNRPMEDLFGWAEGTVVGRDLYEVLGLDQGSTLRRDLPRALLNHGRWEGEVDGLHRDGDLREVQLSVCFLRGTEDAPAGILAVARPRQEATESVVRVDDDENHSEPGLPGLFVLHYQPEVDLQHYSVVSCEALLRWHHPGLGLLSPGGFLGEPDLAARLEALGAWTFFAACRQAGPVDRGPRPAGHRQHLGPAARRPRAGRSSTTRHDRRRRRDGPLRRRDHRGSARVGLRPPPARPCRELAETGSLVMLDDVRSEPAPESWADLPLTGIKLGRSLIDGVASTPDRRATVESTIEIAHDLGLWVTAEGVEAPADLDCVRELGCDGAFGFLLLTPRAPPARSTSTSTTPWPSAGTGVDALVTIRYGPVTWAGAVPSLVRRWPPEMAGGEGYKARGRRWAWPGGCGHVRTIMHARRGDGGRHRPPDRLGGRWLRSRHVDLPAVQTPARWRSTSSTWSSGRPISAASAAGTTGRSAASPPRCPAAPDGRIRLAGPVMDDMSSSSVARIRSITPPRVVDFVRA